MLTLGIFSALAGLIVILTVIAQLTEHAHRPDIPTLREWARLHLSILGLVGTGVGTAAVVVGLLTDLWSFWCAALVIGLALRQLTHPDSWYEFVIKGRPRVPCTKP